MPALAVDLILQAELRDRRNAIAAVDERLLPLVDRLIRFSTTGGKRLRPQFLWWGWRAAGGAAAGPSADVVQRAAASLELIQASALAHDDIIDNSDTRRGEPSLHVAVGVSAAILLGDFALAWADDMFVAAATELGGRSEALDAWRGMRTEVIAGQLMDIRADGSVEDARRVNRFKTAAYTVERPLHLGAALAGATPEVVAALRSFGVHLGLAFQLRDDLLGVFGDASVTGKPAGDDLVEGKQTVLLATARGLLGADLLAELDAGVGVATQPGEVARLAEIVAKSGAPEVIEDEIGALLGSALAALDDVPLELEVVEALTTLARLATDRRS